MVASPAMVPVTMPTRLGFPYLTHSITIHVSDAVAAEMCVLLTGVFVHSALGGTGLPESGSIASQLGVQTIGILATLVWSVLASIAITKGIQATIGLRVKDDDEIKGLDLTTHGESGYKL